MSKLVPCAPQTDESPHFIGLTLSPESQVFIAPFCVFTWLAIMLQGFITIN